MTVRYAGISTQMKASEFPTDKAEAKALVRDLSQQLEVAVRKHVGDARPKGAPMFTMDGPIPDPSHQSVLLQGRPELVYVFTYAVPVEDRDLPADCTAYAALMGGE